MGFVVNGNGGLTASGNGGFTAGRAGSTFCGVCGGGKISFAFGMVGTGGFWVSRSGVVLQEVKFNAVVIANT